ncbi:MAG: hypothetical protein LLG02_09520 [Pelosinus sp.]|nr:hypothetical protein [Pelosinus sp.]
MEKEAAYHYEMVVNIVADMVVEYLKSSNDMKQTDIISSNCYKSEHKQGEDQFSTDAA